MPEVALALGGNIGDPVAAFGAALQALARHPGVEVLACSPVYITPPWGKPDQPDFFNMAALIRTQIPARELLSFCLLIETEAGRKRTERWGPRTLDIDMLTYGGETIDEPGLAVPHPRLAERAFVLEPLAEIAPDMLIGKASVAMLREAVANPAVRRDAAATARLRELFAPGGAG